MERTIAKLLAVRAGVDECDVVISLGGKTHALACSRDMAERLIRHVGWNVEISIWPVETVSAVAPAPMPSEPVSPPMSPF